MVLSIIVYFVVGVCGEMLKYPLPDTAFDPTAEPQVDLYPITKPLRQIAPRHPGPITIQHRLDEQPIARSPTEPSRPGNRPSIRAHWSSEPPHRSSTSRPAMNRRNRRAGIGHPSPVAD
jgi:hypothetical protein